MRRVKYVPKHRGAATEPVVPTKGPRRRGRSAEPAITRSLRKTVTYSGVAVAVTCIAVAGGVAVKDQAPADGAAATIAAAQAERAGTPVNAALRDRERSVSRSDRRTAADKRETLSEDSGGQVVRTESLADQDPKKIARRLMPEYGFSLSEFGCLNQLWVSESDWDYTADNPTSSAYGIPQALTGGTHDNLPADYMTNPVSQIRWGLWYIRESYGTICAARDFKMANNWY